jgi:beta-lactamase regulating signal transducer with metallopeptidase domain
MLSDKVCAPLSSISIDALCDSVWIFVSVTYEASLIKVYQILAALLLRGSQV